MFLLIFRTENEDGVIFILGVKNGNKNKNGWNDNFQSSFLSFIGQSTSVGNMENSWNFQQMFSSSLYSAV